MNEKMRVTTMLLAAVVAGYVGGLMSRATTAAVAAVTKPASAISKSAVSEVVRAKKFELVDAHGKLRGVLGMNKWGDPSLDLRDSAGKERGVFSLLGGDPLLALRDSTGKTRGLFNLLGDMLVLSLCDSKGEPRGMFRLLGDETTLSLRDSAGKERGEFTVRTDGEPQLVLRDSAGEPRGGLRTVEGDPLLALCDSKGELRGMFGINKDETVLSLRDAAGKTVWSAH